MLSGCGHAAIPKNKFSHKTLFFTNLFFRLFKKVQNTFDYSNLMQGDISRLAALPPSCSGHNSL